MIQLNTKIYNQIRQVIKSDNIDMSNIEFVIHYLYSVKCPEAAQWIEQNKMFYRRGLLEGFCIDNTQQSQLKDLHS